MPNSVTPSAPDYTVRNYASAFLALLPTGRVWPRENGATLPLVATGLAQTAVRLSARAGALLQDAPAGDLNELLPEWEATVGLPDPCAGPEPTVTLRRQQVVARVAAQGGQSVPYYIEVAAALGYAITIDEFAPAYADTASADDDATGPDWAYAWRIDVAALTIVYAAADETLADEPVASWGGSVLECEMQRIAPAHAILIFAYSGPAGGAVWDQPAWDRDTWAP